VLQFHRREFVGELEQTEVVAMRNLWRTASVALMVVTLLGSLGCEPGAKKNWAGGTAVASDAPKLASVKQMALDKNPATAPALTAALADADPMVRRFAVYGLERIGNAAAGAAIAPLLADRDVWVRRTAATALGKLGARDQTKALLAALNDGEARVRYDALIALSRIADPATQKPILTAMREKRLRSELVTWEQSLLVEILGQEWFTDPEARQLLLELLNDDQRPHPELAEMDPQRRAQQLKVVPRAAAEVLAMKYADPSGEKHLLEGLAGGGDYEQQDLSRALARIKSKAAVPLIVKVLDSQWMNNRQRAIEALGEIGDPAAVPALEKVLTHQDYRLRRLAAEALRKIDGGQRQFASDGPAAIWPDLPADQLGTPGGKRPPQFIVLGVDDVANVEGVESLVDICETLRARGSRAVFTLWLAPMPSSAANNDLEKRALLYQHLFNLGCEIAHHTMNHNPGGKFWTSLPKEQQIEQIEGCTQWYRDRIQGFTRPLTHKGGGGASGQPIDPEFSQKLLAKQRFIYSGVRGTHPNEQTWPEPSTRRPGTWSIPTGCLDAAAPPVHAEITDPIHSDYPGRFDYPVAEGVAMWKANFEYHYRHPRRPILAVNAFHDWGMRDTVDKFGRPSHRTEGRILKEFLIDVLVTNKDKYPDTYVVTFSQVLEYTINGGDLQRTLAVGNGQDSRNPVKPSFD
jgi:HEAT repeat protein